jgi:mono/diheme cytochrome c family protein
MKMRVLALFALMGIATTGFAAAPGKAQQIAEGEKLYKYWCSGCHGPGIGQNGAPYLPGETALRAKYKGAVPGLLHERTDLTPEFVKLFVRQGITIMPFFRKTEIDDQQLDAIAAYLTRNSKTK